ncbi:hypothetical protein THAOC_25924, partial [Thalassiosira oceanica]
MKNLRAFLSLLFLGDPANAFNTHPGHRRARIPVLSTATSSIKLSEENTEETATVQQLEVGVVEDDVSPPAPISPEGLGDDSEEESNEDIAEGISYDGETET